MHTIIIKHDGQGLFKAIGTNGDPINIILIEDDHMDEANIKVGNDSNLIGQNIIVESKPELVNLAIQSFKPSN